MPWCLVGSEDDRAGRLRRGEEISGEVDGAGNW